MAADRGGGLGILVRKMGDYVIPTSQAALWKKVLVCSVSPGPGTKETAPEPCCGPLLPPPLTSVTKPEHGKGHLVPGPRLTTAVLLRTPGEGLAGHGQGEQSGSQLGPEPLFFDDQTPTRGPLRGGRVLQGAPKFSHHHFSKTGEKGGAHGHITHPRLMARTSVSSQRIGSESLFCWDAFQGLVCWAGPLSAQRRGLSASFTPLMRGQFQVTCGLSPGSKCLHTKTRAEVAEAGHPRPWLSFTR